MDYSETLVTLGTRHRTNTNKRTNTTEEKKTNPGMNPSVRER
jgi:hypothetical protein